MYIYGHYYNEKEQRVEVRIVTGKDRSEAVEIGCGDGRMDWTDDPVEITSEVSDTMDVVLKQKASVRLMVRGYEEALFSSTARDAMVNIVVEGKCVFAGYVEPMAYNQDYQEEQDELELSCVDALSATDLQNYGGVGMEGVGYESAKRAATRKTLKEIVTGVVEAATEGLDLTGGEKVKMWVDGNVYRTEKGGKDVLAGLSVSERIFYGSSADDVWTQEEVLEEVLRYGNLHIRQEGLEVYVYRWETLRTEDRIDWLPLTDGTEARTEEIREVGSEAWPMDTGGQVSVSEVYNQLKLTAKTEAMETLVASPLDSESMRNVYDGKQKLLTELSSEGEGVRALRGMRELVKQGWTSWGCSSVTDWYVMVRSALNWTFYGLVKGKRKDLVGHFGSSGKNQEALPEFLGRQTGAAALLQLGKVKKDNGANDNSPTSKVDMTDCLVVSVNGNGVDEDGKSSPTEADLTAAAPCAVYESQTEASFSPTDEETTNYVVIGGRLVLNGLLPMTDTYTNLSGAADGDFEKKGRYWHKTVWTSVNGDHKKYYTRKHWKAETWKDTPTLDTDPDRDGETGLIPWTEDGEKQYEYKYNAPGDGADRLSKVGVLACMLRIGDKCVVELEAGEKNGDWTSEGKGQLRDFVWRKYKTLEECGGDEDEYWKQTFTIGFDPKKGDHMINEEHSVQLNFDLSAGLDSDDGTAIPIRRSDKVYGKVRFEILGPVNTYFADVSKRHRTWFRKEKWTEKAVPLLAHVSNIVVKDLSVKVVSNNGGMTVADDDKDIVYMSDTKETFMNRKDDLEMKLTTGLTSKECKAAGVQQGVWLTTPLDVEKEESVTAVYDPLKDVTAKPEQLYVDALWAEWHTPRVVYEKTMDDVAEAVSPFWRYRSRALGKTMIVEGIDRNLTEGTVKMTLKETETKNLKKEQE